MCKNWGQKAAGLEIEIAQVAWLRPGIHFHCPPIMSVHQPVQPSNIYRERLSSLNHGLALWNPKPVDNLYNHISIGDVGYLLENGAFMRLFNVTLPWDDPSNSLLEVPEQYKRLELGHFINVHSSELREREYCSHVCKVDNINANTHNE